MILSNNEMYDINKKLKIKNLMIINKDDLYGIKYNNKYNYIINIDKKENNGSHWVAIYKNIYFDSYGLKPPNSIEDYFKKGYYMNDKQIQPLNNNSQYCGWICMMFLHYMNNKYDKNKNDDYNNFIDFIKLFDKNKLKNKKIIYDYFINIIK